MRTRLGVASACIVSATSRAVSASRPLALAWPSTPCPMATRQYLSAYSGVQEPVALGAVPAAVATLAFPVPPLSQRRSSTSPVAGLAQARLAEQTFQQRDREPGTDLPLCGLAHGRGRVSPPPRRPTPAPGRQLSATQ